MRTFLEEVKSPAGDWKAAICRRDDGRFQVVLMRWVEEAVVAEYGDVATYWSEVDAAGAVAGTLDGARAIARELLECHARPGRVAPAHVR